MHELGIVMNVIHMITQDASSRGFRRVKSVELEVGEFSGALPHALKEAFRIAAEGTLLDGATLVIDEVQAELCCKDCGRTFFPGKQGWNCPYCGAGGADLIRGMELQVKSYIGEAEECQSK
ncbi:MAG TPA: hydrogenase maturation nickel metallochaperone HypA [Firmicutes bacterium]|nr:hydrogenase maturation nickel metallochaperone HypA [Candidatus Fermentithermobacillaceae bacterium]